MVEASVTPAEILAFWRNAGPARWYSRDDAFDAEVRRRFLGLWQRAAAGELSSWETSDDGALAVGVAYPKRTPDPGEPLSDNKADWHFDFIFARRFTSREKLSSRQWAGYIHKLHIVRIEVRRLRSRSNIAVTAGVPDPV